jgi:hypothetical protein
MSRSRPSAMTPEFPWLVFAIVLCTGWAIAFWMHLRGEQELKQNIESDSQFLISMLQGRFTNLESALSGLSQRSALDRQNWNFEADHLMFQYPELQSVLLFNPQNQLTQGVPAESPLWADLNLSIHSKGINPEDTVLFQQGIPTFFWERKSWDFAGESWRIAAAVDPQRLAVECLQDRRLHRRGIEVYWKGQIIYSNRLENTSHQLLHSRKAALRGEREEMVFNLRPTIDQYEQATIHGPILLALGTTLFAFLLLMWLRMYANTRLSLIRQEQINQDLEFQKSKALEQGQLQHEFLHLLSHEAKAPLEAIAQQAEGLLESLQLEHNRSTAHAIVFGARCISTAIQDFEERSADQTPNFQFIRKSLQMQIILDQWLYAHQTKAHKKNISLELQSQANDILVLGDPYRIWQALLHLGIFVLDFLENTHLTVQLQQSPSTQWNKVRIIFLWPSTAQRPDTTRLSLKIASEIAQAHGGWLTMDLESPQVHQIQIEMTLAIVSEKERLLG